MLVLHVMEAVSGGTARHLIDVIRNVPDVHHAVAIPRRRPGWVQDVEPARRIEDAGGQVNYVNMRRQPAHPANLAAVVAIRRMIRRLQPDIVHGHSSIGGAIARLGGGSMPCIYTPNAVSPHPAALRLERWLARRTTRVIAVSDSEARLFRELRLVPPDRLLVIRNGIDLEPPPATGEPLRGVAGVAAEAPLVGWVGRLVPQKSPAAFVEACAAVAEARPEVHFVMIGTGPLEGSVRQAIQDHGLGSHFHLVPWIEDAAAHLAEIDVVVSTAAFEGGPYVPMEAMRASVPVVLTAVTGNVDVVEDGVSGILVPPDDPAALGAAVAGLVADPELRSRLARAGHERFVERFDARLMGGRLAEVYREVTKG